MEYFEETDTILCHFMKYCLYAKIVKNKFMT